jgi:hypothetical protein
MARSWSKNELDFRGKGSVHARILMRRGMDKDLQELARRLFTVATAILEDATIIAVAGQSHKLTEKSCEHYACELQRVGRDVTTLAESAALMARLSRQTARKPPKKSRR